MSISALTAQTIALFEPVPQKAKGSLPPPDVHAHIDRLAHEARSGCQEAIELLGNLAVAVPDTRPAQADDPLAQRRQQAAVKATQALLTIFSHPDTADGVRASIRQFSLDLFETADRAPAAPQREADDEQLPLHVPTRLLSLALHQACSARQPEIQRKVGEALHGRLGEWLGESVANLSSPDRYTGFEEIHCALSATGTECLGLQPQPLTFGDAGFAVDLRSLADQVKEDGALRTVIVKQGGHWVAALIGPAGPQDDRVAVTVYDSLHAPDHENAVDLAGSLHEALGEDLLATVTYAGGNVQGDTNGCGPLCVRALRGLEAAMGANVVTSMADVGSFLQSEVETSSEWSEEKVKDLVAGLRADMAWRFEIAAEELALASIK